MEAFLPFFIILFASITFGSVFEKIHLPWVVALIIAGIFIGPQGFNFVQNNPTLQFIAETGLVFVMFMAGLETKLNDPHRLRTEIAPIAIINGLIPFLFGFGIGLFFDYSLVVSTLIGIIFISSSIAIVVPSLQSNNILNTRLGQDILGTSILQDVASLVLLSLFLQTETNQTILPLWLFYPLLIFSLVGMKLLLPRLEKYLINRHSQDHFQVQIRTVFLTLFGTVIIFELLGLHSIIAGFFAGFVLADTLTSPVLKQKINAISYGVFVPTFFVLIGMETNLQVLFQSQNTILISLLIIISSVFSKLSSGYLGAKLVGFNHSQSILFGVTSIPQLSTTLAATYSASNLGLIDQSLFTGLIILSIITTLIGPGLMNLSISNIITSKDLHHTT